MKQKNKIRYTNAISIFTLFLVIGVMAISLVNTTDTVIITLSLFLGVIIGAVITFMAWYLNKK